MTTICESAAEAVAAPDGSYQAPLTVTDKVEMLTWSTEPFETTTELIGTGAAHLFVEIDTDDTNLILPLWDEAPGGSRQLVTTGYLKASHRELDDRTTEGNPYHPHTRAVPVEPGKVEEYVLRLYPLANAIRPGHRLVGRSRHVGTHLYGRRMYETMRVWQTVGLEGAGPDAPDPPPEELDYAEVWRAIDKIVFSRTLPEVSTPRTELLREFEPEAVRRLKESADRDLSVSGPDLAQHAFAAGLVDEVRLYAFPVIVGGGKPGLPRGVRVGLTLLDERRFGNGVVHMRYATA